MAHARDRRGHGAVGPMARQPRLEREAQRELHFARVTALAGDLAKSCVPPARVRAAPFGVVEPVVYLRAERDSLSLANPEVLRKGEIVALRPLSSDIDTPGTTGFAVRPLGRPRYDRRTIGILRIEIVETLAELPLVLRKERITGKDHVLRAAAPSDPDIVIGIGKTDLAAALCDSGD
jgi:hypothetical protein